MGNRDSTIVRSVLKPPGCYLSLLGGVLGAVLLLFLLALGPLTRLRSTPILPNMPLEVIESPSESGAAATDSTAGEMPLATISSDQMRAESLHFAISDQVEVFGTDGAGLRLRSSPTLQAGVNAIAPDGELFTVVEGPREADGYVWWQLVNSNVSSRQGWAVGNFLRAASNR